MKNTLKLMTAAALVASTTTAAFAGNPEAVLNNQVEEPIIVENDQDWLPLAGAGGLALLALCAIACGSSGGGGSSTTSTTVQN